MTGDAEARRTTPVAGAFLSPRCLTSAVTSTRRHPGRDERAVFERDDRACRRCGATDDEGADLRAHPVGPAVASGERDDADVHESRLVTVCATCLGALEAPDEDGPRSISTDALFSAIRSTTRHQGAVISEVASLATVATELPGAFESDADVDGGRGASEAIGAFVDARRDVWLAIEVVDGRLARLEAVELEGANPDAGVEADGPTDGGDLEPRLAAFLETATALQSDLRTVVELAETVANGLDRCHGCGGALEADSGSGSDTASERCPTCDLERLGGAWDGGDAREASEPFESLCSTINARLTGTADRTEELTERTTALAEGLVARGVRG